MGSVFFYGALCAFVAGIFFESLVPLASTSVAFIFLLGSVFFFLSRVAKDSSVYLTVGILFLSFGFGVLRMELAASYTSPLRVHEGEKVELVGRVVREPEVRGSMRAFTIAPNTKDVDEYVLVTADRFDLEVEQIAYGDTVSVLGVLKTPDSFVTDTGRMFDYQGYLRARDVHHTISFAKLTLLEEGEGFGKSLYAAKGAFLTHIRRAIPEPEASLGAGVLLGVRGVLGDALERTFRETGIIHIIVLSGYNIMIVVQVFMWVLSRYFFPRTRMLIGAGAVMLFAFLVGFSATVVRASLMAILLLIARGTGQTYVVLRVLMIAGVLMLMHNPYLLVYDIGFALSFLATLGLILFAPHVSRRLTKVPERFGVREFAAATIATQIFVLPILLYATGMASVIAVFVNVLVLPVVPLAMLLTFLTGVLGTFTPSISTVVGYGAYVVLGYIILIAESAASVPGASFTIDVFPFWIVVLAYAALAYWIWYMKSRGTKTGALVTDAHDESTSNFDGWEIVEEYEVVEGIEKSPRETRSVSRGDFPFR